MSSNSIPPVDFFGATIQTAFNPGGWSWSAQLPPVPGNSDDCTYADGKLYPTSPDAQKAAERYLKCSAAKLELLRAVGELFERRDGTLPQKEYSALSESITLSDLD